MSLHSEDIESEDNASKTSNQNESSNVEVSEIKRISGLSKDSSKNIRKKPIKTSSISQNPLSIEDSAKTSKLRNRNSILSEKSVHEVRGNKSKRLSNKTIEWSGDRKLGEKRNVSSLVSIINFDEQSEEDKDALGETSQETTEEVIEENASMALLERRSVMFVPRNSEIIPSITADSLAQEEELLEKELESEKLKTQSVHKSTVSTLLSHQNSIISSNKRRLSQEIRKLYSMRPTTSRVSIATKIIKKDKGYKGKEFPTYQLGPRSPFSSDRVTSLIVGYQDFATSKMPIYKADAAEVLATIVANHLRKAVNDLRFNRYKLCVMVIIGEKKYQGYQSDCRCLWAKEYDSVAFWTIESSTYFMQIMCFGLYKD